MTSAHSASTAAQPTTSNEGAGVPPASGTARLLAYPRRSIALSLLIKDWRLCKPAIIAGAIALLIPPAAAFLGRALGDGLPLAVHPEDVAQFRLDMARGLVFGLALATLTLPVVAAVALARERRDRSGEFLRTLPVHRATLLLSKLLIGATWSIVLCAIAFGLIELVRPGHASDWDADHFWGFKNASAGDLLIIPGIALAMIGVAWSLASFLRSEAIAAAVGIGGSAGLVVFLFSLQDRVFHMSGDALQERAFLLLVASIFIAIGLAGLISGSIITIRRRSP